MSDDYNHVPLDDAGTVETRRKGTPTFRADGTCNCSVMDTCPLGKTGHTLRCTLKEVVAFREHTGQPTISLAEQLAYAQSELEMRRRIDPEWVNYLFITQEQADYRAAIMQAIVATLTGLVEEEQDNE